MFAFTEEQQQQYKENKWFEPRRCPACRNAQRQRNDPFEGWNCTMGANFRHKQRHSRVAYAPYTVGGFH
ncbi:MAG: zinc-ribbon domain containing protein [Rikenellaceae bacterium]